MERRRKERRQGFDRRQELSYLSVPGLDRLSLGDRRQVQRRKEDQHKDDQHGLESEGRTTTPEVE